MKTKKILVLVFLFLIPAWEFQKEPDLKFYRIIPREEEKISHQNLFDEIVASGIKFPEIAFVQAIIESGNFTSGLFKKHNNLFGMRFPGRRETTSIGRNKRGYARYEDWDDSVKDYFHWQSFFMKRRDINTKEEYLDLLDDVYAEDKSYVTVIRKNIKQYKHIFD
jgi:uncharacterized FlgJ-related protein